MTQATSTVFISDDNRKFNTKAECEEWESSPRVYLLKKSYMQSHSGERVHIIYQSYKMAKDVQEELERRDRCYISYRVEPHRLIF